MTTYTDAKDLLLMTVGDYLIGTGNVRNLDAAYKAAQAPAEPKPSAYGHQEHCNHPGSPCTCEEPKPSAGVKDEKTERNKRVQARYEELMHEGNHGFYESLFRIVREEVERTDAADDKDTATVIADNDAKMKQLEELARQRNEYARKISEMQEEIERLKRSLELYRADIAVMREREEKMTAEQTTLREEIAAYKDVKSYDRKLIDMLAKKNQALSHPDIDAAADRAREDWIAEQSPQMNWVGAWRVIARAVYGIKSEGG